MKFNPEILIKLLLVIFIFVGLGLTIFMVMQHVKIIGAYIVSGMFILFPGLLLYGIIFGFTVSDKAIRQQAERKETLTFDDEGIVRKMPLFDCTQFINWKTIETVIYTNYLSDDNAKFIFYLTDAPIQQMSENPWFLNRIFPFATGKKKEITIKDDNRNFNEIPKMLQMYLVNTKPIDLNQDNRKGILINSKTVVKNQTITTVEHWKPNNNYESEKVIYDKQNRTLEQKSNR